MASRVLTVEQQDTLHESNAPFLLLLITVLPLHPAKAQQHNAFKTSRSLPSLQNLNQNPRTLLPKFFGLYCVQSGGKNIRVVVMNNVLPRVVRMHLKYDLKGSTYKRRASKKEREKAWPTFKDLDFMQDLQDGLMLDQDTYGALVKTLQRDCLVSGPGGGDVTGHSTPP